jgi:hypothetical protein
MNIFDGSMRVKVLTHNLIEIHSTFHQAYLGRDLSCSHREMNAGKTYRHLLGARRQIEPHAICSEYYFALEYVTHTS